MNWPWPIAARQKACSKQTEDRALNKVPFYRVLYGLLTAVCTSTASAVETVDLHHHLADELMPRLQVLLEPGEIIMPNGAGLLLQASPQRTALLREWILKLDQPQHRLRITLIQAESPPDGGRNTARSYRLPPRRQPGSVLEVQTLDGKSALIKLTAPPPMSSRRPAGFYPPLPLPPSDPARSPGFAVTPRLLDDQVIIEIEPVSMPQGQVRTTLRATLGEWVEIARQSDHPLPGTVDEGHRHYSTPERTQGFYIKVEKLDHTSGKRRLPIHGNQEYGPE